MVVVSFVAANDVGPGLCKDETTTKTGGHTIALVFLFRSMNPWSFIGLLLVVRFPPSETRKKPRTPEGYNSPAQISQELIYIQIS